MIKPLTNRILVRPINRPPYFSESHFGTATGPHAFALALCRAYLVVIRSEAKP